MSELKLEVGKTYISQVGNKIKILAATTSGHFVGEMLYLDSYYPRVAVYKENGNNLSLGLANLSHEYKEPIVHKRDVVWYLLPESDKIHCITLPVGSPLPVGFQVSGRELSRSTIQFIENQ